MKTLGFSDDFDLYISVALTGSFSETGRVFEMPASSVMRRINNLEEKLETRLINRSTKKLVLTETGALFLKHARKISENINQARNEIKEHTSSAVGTLRVSAPVAFGRRHIAPLVSTLLKKNPGLKLDFSLNDRIADPVGEKLDLCIRLGILPDSSLICSKLAGLRRVLCASPEYLLKHGLPRTPEELERHTCLQHNGCSNASLSWQFSSADITRRIRISPVSRLSVNSAELLVEGALQGLGIIHAPTWLVHEEVASGRLVTFLDRHALPEQAQGGIYALRPQGSVVPAKISLFLSELKSAIGEMPYWDLPFQQTPAQLAGSF
ncbi:LysR family transcriptional regulator [Pseudomonas aeruginosa]|uniref:LysR family transcriptional regulator n=1 Tax=Pseudomonas aeruginosa TaxID=287 RepID=UPI000B493856|nr:LysR family transcriptional regulator [Pseudomonas aeruginosa]